jgi:FkbM family methyltransferase
MKETIKNLLPKSILQPLRRWLRERREQQFSNQELVNIYIGEYQLLAPQSHMLIGLAKTQPLRDYCVEITARFAGAKYPRHSIIDIGANIGDTAPRIALHTDNDMMLVEPSPFYAKLLRINISKIPRRIQVIEALVGSGKPLIGELNHWGGTAYFHETSDADVPQLPTLTLADISDQPVCFIKIDTDGHDFSIILNNLGWLRQYQPALLFEDAIRNSHELEQAQKTVEALATAGYTHFIIWDDPGYFITSTTDPDVLRDLNKYLALTFENDHQRRLWNFDVLCLAGKDEDIYHQVSSWFRSYTSQDLRG